jgi:hypothetical protein
MAMMQGVPQDNATRMSALQTQLQAQLTDQLRDTQAWLQSTEAAAQAQEQAQRTVFAEVNTKTMAVSTGTREDGKQCPPATSPNSSCKCKAWRAK